RAQTRLSEPLRHAGRVTAVAFSPNGLTVATSSSDHTARLWDAHSGVPLSDSFQHPDVVTALAFTSDGKWIVTGCSDGVARFWSVPDPMPDDPTLIHNWAMAQTGLELDAQHAVRSLSPAGWLKAKNAVPGR